MSEHKFPKLALGTWLMGGMNDPDPNNNDEMDIAVIHTAIENKITLIDTAQNYAGGKCEELIGRAVATYPRDSYQILTKQTKDALSYDEVIKGCIASLQRMGLDYIDYFVCHAPNVEADMRDFFKAANQLHKDGLIRNVGVSNFGVKTLRIALDSSDVPMCVNQVSFSLEDDNIISTGTYKFCVDNKIPIQAFRTFAALKDDTAAFELLSPIAEAHSITKQQAVIAFLNSYQGIDFTIRASSDLHWQQLKSALTIELSSEEIMALKQFQYGKQGSFRKLLLI